MDIGLQIVFAGGSLLCFVLGVKILRGSVRSFGMLRRVWGDTADPIDVGDVTKDSAAAVSGTARPTSEGTIRTPFSKGEALIAVGTTLKRGSEGQPTTDERVVETVPFSVEDGTGSIRVEPDEGDFHVERERIDPDEVDRSALEEWRMRTGVEDESPIGYGQRVVAPGDEVYVFGEAVAADGSLGERNEPSRTNLRLTGTDDGMDIVISTEGRDRVGGNSLARGIILLLFGGLLLFFAMSFFVALLISLA